MLVLTVNSLYEINEVLSELTGQEYNTMRQNACEISTGLREGYYTRKALKKCLELVNGSL